jgi:hypothetical protein
MASLEDHIGRILGESNVPLTAVEITLLLNAEFIGNHYKISEIVASMDKMPNVYRSGKEYCRAA